MGPRGGASIRQGSLGLALGTSCSRGVTQIGLEGALSERGRSNGPLRSFVQGGSSEVAVIDMVAQVGLQEALFGRGRPDWP